MGRCLAAMLGFLLGCSGAVTEEQQAAPVALHLYVVTSGADLDPDGYAAVLDDRWRTAVESNGQAMFEGVAPGRHSLALDGIADNCKVKEANPQTISLDAGSPQSVQFSVSCLPAAGTLEATVNNVGTVATRGRPFRLAVPQLICFWDSCGLVPMGFLLGENSPLVIPVTAGELTLTLTAPANCEVIGPNPRVVTVAARQTAAVLFDFFCQ